MNNLSWREDGHWASWRAAVTAAGVTESLTKASNTLQLLDRLSAQEVEWIFKDEADRYATRTESKLRDLQITETEFFTGR